MCSKKLFVEAPKCVLVARKMNLNPTNSRPLRTIKLPARYELLKQAATDRLLLNWFGNAWGKTKNQILENWESAGLTKNRKAADEGRTAIGGALRKSTEEMKSQTKEMGDELAKAKNKAQRQLAENWDAIRQANSKTSQTIVDSVKESATSKVEDASKSAKQTGKLQSFQRNNSARVTFLIF